MSRRRRKNGKKGGHREIAKFREIWNNEEKYFGSGWEACWHVEGGRGRFGRGKEGSKRWGGGAMSGGGIFRRSSAASSSVRPARIPTVGPVLGNENFRNI